MLNEVSTTTATSISLSWSVPTDSVVTQYLVEWQRDTSVGCTDEDQGNTTITDGSTVSYDIPELEENSRYMMTVTVSNSAGSSGVSNSVTAMTLVAGERESDITSSTQWRAPLPSLSSGEQWNLVLTRMDPSLATQ